MKARIKTMALPASGKGLVMRISADSGDGRSGPVPAGFDPWTAKYDASSALQAVGTPAFAQWVAAQAISSLRESIESQSDGVSLLTAISLAARHGLVMPGWLATAYIERFIRFERVEVASLDDAFGHVPSTERKRAAAEKKKKLLPQVSELLVKAIAEKPDRAIDNELFDEIAGKLQIGRGPCRDLYDEGVRTYGLQDLKELKRLLKRYKESGESDVSPVIKKQR